MTTRAKPSSAEAELLARLGLPADASSQQVEATHDELVAFLDKAPADLRPWSRREIAVVDEAFALLSDPTIDRSAALAPALAATAPVSAATAPPLPGTVAAGGAAPADDDELAELAGEHPATRHGRREAERRAHAAARREAAAPTGNGSRRGLIRLAIGAAAVVGIVAVGLIGYNLNGGTGIPAINGSPAPEASSPASVDTAQLSALMKKISTDPKDTASLQAIGDLYYQAGDYTTSATWYQKVVDADSKNTKAHLALGAALFNQSKTADAETQWKLVIAADPKNVEAYYDLGFMYLSQNPPNMAKVKENWNQVIAISPDSDVAKTVKTHLDSLNASPAPSGAASSPAAASPAASAAPSPAPSN